MQKFMLFLVIYLALINNIEAEDRNPILYKNLPPPPNIVYPTIGTEGIVYLKNNCFYLKNSLNNKDYLVIWPFDTKLYNKKIIIIKRRNKNGRNIYIPLNKKIILGGIGVVANKVKINQYNQCIGKNGLIINTY